MQLILDIEESQKDIVLNIIKNLREGIIKRYTLRSSNHKIERANIETVSIEEEEEIKNILQNMTSDDRELADIRKYSINL
jgi:anthranilate phosphoribosyltransferase